MSMRGVRKPGLADHHLRRPRPAARPGHEGRGDEPGPRAGAVSRPRLATSRHRGNAASRLPGISRLAGAALDRPGDLRRRPGRHRDRPDPRAAGAPGPASPTSCPARSATRPRRRPSCPASCCCCWPTPCAGASGGPGGRPVAAADPAWSSTSSRASRPRPSLSLVGLGPALDLPGRVRRARRPAHPLARRAGVRLLVVRLAGARASRCRAPARRRRWRRPSFGRSLQHTALGLFGIEGPLRVHASDRDDDLVGAMLLGLGLMTALTTVYLALRPPEPRPR